MIDFRSDLNRKALTEWEVLVPGAGGRREDFVDELEQALEAEGIGEVARVRARVGEIVRVKRATNVGNTLEADTLATSMGRQLHVAWRLYWRPKGRFTIDRAWMNNDERAEARPFAMVTVSLTHTVAGEYVEEGAALPPLEPSGVSGAI